MSIAEDCAGSAEARGAHAWSAHARDAELDADAPLGAALGVAESVAKLHGGEVRLRARDDGGGLLVELRFPIPNQQA